MLTVLSVIGTRPEAIKMAPVIKELEKHSVRTGSIPISTVRHRDRFDQEFNLFRNRPVRNRHCRGYVVLTALCA